MKYFNGSGMFFLISFVILFCLDVPAEVINQEAEQKVASIRNPTQLNGNSSFEIVDATYEFSKNRLNSYSCHVKNKSSKDIVAFSLLWTVVWVKDGKEVETTYSQAIDCIMHEDIRAQMKLRNIQPGQVRYLESPGPIDLDENTIPVSVTVSAAYVEFVDGTVVGTNLETGKQRIIGVRLGAILYKKWLQQEFLASPSAEKFMNQLKSGEVPENLGISDIFLKQGAGMYRSWLLSIYKNQGLDAVQTILNTNK